MKQRRGTSDLVAEEERENNTAGRDSDDSHVFWIASAKPHACIPKTSGDQYLDAD